MSSPEAVFKIIEDNNCPLYAIDDEFRLSGQALLLKGKEEKTFITTSVIKIPHEKPACRILVEDITAVLIKYESMKSVNRCVINCSGCSGMVRLEYRHRKGPPAPPIRRGGPGGDLSALVSLLYIFPIFQTLDERDIERIVPMLRMKKYAKGTTILRRGEIGEKLYIIISGKVEVLVEEGLSIGYMERGDVFGEISLLVGSPIGATIRVVEPTRVLFINAPDFKRILAEFPSLQSYFARLMAERLARTNDERAEDVSSGMIGTLSEMSPSELFQTLNLNRKTGVLNLVLPKGPAKVLFNGGGLVRARYNEAEGRDAFFEILREKKGRFKFVQGISDRDAQRPEIGEFMWLLMEGIRRIDEEATG